MEGGPTVRYDGLLSRSKDKVEVEFVRAVTGDEVVSRVGISAR